MSGDRPGAGYWWPPRLGFAVFGATVGTILTGLLALTNLTIGSASSSTALGELTPFVLTAAFVLALVSYVGRRGASFTVGFLASLAVLTVLSLGSCTSEWADPIRYGASYLREEGRIATREREAREKEEKWRDSIRTNGIDRADGARRALYFFACVARYRREHDGRIPPDSLAMARTTGCRDIDGMYRPGRSGWRWRYAVTRRDSAGNASGFVVESHPDTVLRLAGPLYRIGDDGVFVEMAGRGAPAFAVASPLPALAALRDCIAAAGEYAGEAYERNGRRYPVATLADIRRLPYQFCNEVGIADFSAIHGDDSTLVAGPNFVALTLPKGMKGYQVITRWALIYEPRGTNPGDRFDLLARPRSMFASGGRSYRLPDDGVATATTEQRAATRDDPQALPCESTPTAPCVGVAAAP